MNFKYFSHFLHFSTGIETINSDSQNSQTITNSFITNWGISCSQHILDNFGIQVMHLCIKIFQKNENKIYWWKRHLSHVQNFQDFLIIGMRISFEIL